MSPIICRGCRTRFPAKQFSQQDWENLSQLYYFDEAVAELAMVRKVVAFYERHPYAEDKIQPHVIECLESDDPDVQAQLFDHVPFDQIRLPDKPPVVVPRTAEDAEVIDYLRHTSCDFRGRLPGLEAQVAAGRGHIATVSCPHCQRGELHVPREHFWEFEQATQECTNFYWPDWHSFDDDGTLHVKVSGYIGMSHWNGMHTVKPPEPEYAFWRWFVAQPEHHHLMEEKEFEQIRAAYHSAATQSN